MEQKNQVIWTTRCKVMAKYISIYFDIFQQNLNGKIIAKKISRRGRPPPYVSREVFVKGSLWCEKLLDCGFGPALESKQILSVR